MGMFMLYSFGYAQDTLQYKSVDSIDLFLEVYYPEQLDSNQSYPAMIFFFGGGWNGGKRGHFRHHAEYFSQRGLVCFLVDYRIKSVHKTSPFESLKDAKSVIRFIRKHAARFHVDTAQIIASGGSAGGHLAAATALSIGFDENSDDLSISCIPNALVLFNPVMDNGPGGYGYARIGEAYKDFSPLHNIRSGAPPTIIFLGTKDHLVPVIAAQYYQTMMERVESRCELKLYEDQKHGFFNYQFFDYYRETLEEADNFLQSLGYLKAEPMVPIR